MGHRTRYSTIAIGLHWLIAILIFSNIWFGWRMSHLNGLAKFELFQLHKSVGITVLLLSLLRLGWRLLNPAPPYPAHMSRGDKLTATSVHWLLYAFMIVQPLTGWIVVSASLYNLPTLLYKTVPWPHMGFVHNLPIATRKIVEHQVGTVHEWLAWTFLALALFHVAAALKHQFWDHDDVLARMLPLVRRRPSIQEI
ncbi:MAG: cytochrome b [Caulobacteraceae bacterium]|nr:cytochrome b [Caulobacteraceae bacterium]